MPLKPKTARDSFRYLPILERQKAWGLYLTNCGRSTIEPGMRYPAQQHPVGYQFDYHQGRTLLEYQVVYLTQGHGIFETQEFKNRRITAGDVFLLFPGVWHRYKPDLDIGWDEQWIGFNGDLAAHFMQEPFFSAKTPILHIGFNERLLQCFISIIEAVTHSPAGAPYANAGNIITLLGLLQEQTQGDNSNRQHSDIILKAQNLILDSAAEPINFEKLAISLGLSYSGFRQLFKQQTGFSPAQYQSSIRLNRAREMLKATNLSVTQIAEECGFENIYYFSRVFKQKTKLTPTAYRQNS